MSGARAQRLALNLPTHERPARVGMSEKTLRNLKRCTLDTFVHVLEVLNALGDLQHVLITQTRSIEAMHQQALAQAKPRQRASSPRRVKPD